MASFQNFALKIGTSGVVKSILANKNANDVSMYVWFIHYRRKN